MRSSQNDDGENPYQPPEAPVDGRAKRSWSKLIRLDVGLNLVPLAFLLLAIAIAVLNSFMTWLKS